MCAILEKGCFNCRYMERPAYLPPCNHCNHSQGPGFDEPICWAEAQKGLHSGGRRGLRPRGAYAPEGGAEKEIRVLGEDDGYCD